MKKPTRKKHKWIEILYDYVLLFKQDQKNAAREFYQNYW